MSRTKMIIEGLFSCKLKSDTPLNVERDGHGDIIAVQINENDYIRRFKPISYNIERQKVIVKPRYIEEVKGSGMKEFYIRQEKLNVTTLFLLPLVVSSINIKNIQDKILNCYCWLGEPKDTIDSLYLIVRLSGDSRIVSFHYDVQFFANCVEVTDIDIQHFCAEFKIPSMFKDDVKLIQEGKYSYISDLARKHILHYYIQGGMIKGSVEKSIIHGVLYRSEFRRKSLENKLGVEIPDDLDLYDKFDPIKETYLTKLMAINGGINDDSGKSRQDTQSSDSRSEKKSKESIS